MFGRKRGPMDPGFPLAAEPVSGSAVDTPATPPTPAGPAARLPASVLAAAAAAPPRPAAPPRSAVQAMMTSQPVSAPTPAPAPAPVCAPASAPEMASEDFLRTDTFRTLRTAVFAGINVSAAVTRSRDQVRGDLTRLVGEIVSRDRLLVTMAEQLRAVEELLNDMFGIGPIEPLLADDTVTDILVNGPDQVFVERHGRLELTPLKFRDNAHVTNVAQRIAASIGRRVDESSPMVDARLADGSRVNVVLPPLAIRGTCLSIRKFAKRNVTLHRMVMQGNLSTAMARVLEVACACRTNIIISGGTGSGKTTLMNAMSRVIDERERIITIEDAAELQLQQPHVVSLETRPEGIEGGGMVDQRQLVKNALRMRPDRIILGETRGAEAFDVLQAMNTGHDGSMTTLHANTPRDALTRLESMVLLAAGSLPLLSIRRQIASAVQMIVQLERMRDGVRRITHVTEIAGMEGDVIITQDLFTFRYDDSTYGDEVKGTYESTGLRPVFSTRASYYGLEKALMEAIQG